MDFSAFSLREVQNFLAISQMAEAEGITDLRFVRAQLQAHLDRQTHALRPTYAERETQRKVAAKGRTEAQPCPSCGRQTLLPAATLEGLLRVGCRSCGYSAVVGAA